MVSLLKGDEDFMPKNLVKGICKSIIRKCKSFRYFSFLYIPMLQNMMAHDLVKVISYSGKNNGLGRDNDKPKAHMYKKVFN